MKEFEAESPLRHATHASDMLKRDMAEEDYDEDATSPRQPDNAEAEESQEDK